MSIYEHSTVVDLAPAVLFAELNDLDALVSHMPRRPGGEPTNPWVRVEEPDCTLTWGSDRHHPGSLDVLPEGHGSRLTVRVSADTDVSAQLMIAVEALRTRFEESRAA